MIDNVGALVARLRKEVESLEDSGNLELSYGMIAAMRIITDELNLDDAIGGEVVAVEPVEVDAGQSYNLDAELAPYVEKINTLTLRNASLMSLLGGLEANRITAVDYCEKLTLSFNRYKGLRADVDSAESAVARLSTCRKCSGTGMYRPMFEKRDCVDCDGSGANPNGGRDMIITQQKLIRTQKTLIGTLLHDLFTTGLTKADKEAVAVEHFYADCKTNVRCD